ncbi:MAG TPA: serine/threonine-protein kinase, partial [Kofleriaceae bacterium]|nr:serine/threonine-protein kinase [Kofleriaceae bacterium]
MTRGPTPSDLPVRAGDRIAGRFELRGEAAHGGMGSVFRARDRRDGHDVAIKVLRDSDARGRARFAREAAILAELCHPNVVRYLGHGATPDGVHYLIMAWLDGTTLAHTLAHRAPSLAEIIEIARQTCRALAALHARGVVHRDVKPANLMLGADSPPVVTLVDLGVARRRDELDALTRTGALVGTTGYLAPEQACAASVVDARADLFALGCVLYLALTGTPAFAGDSALAIYAKLMLHHPPPVRALAPDVPPALDALVARLLARRPDDRPANTLDIE